MFVMACSGCGGGGGAASPTPIAQVQPKPVLIETYGDSTTVACTVTPGVPATEACPTNGYGVASTTEPQALQTLLQKSLGTTVTVSNKGVASITTDDLLNGTGRENGRTWEASMSASTAQIVTINTGINDSASEDYAADLRNLIAIAKAHGKTVIIFTPNQITNVNAADLASRRQTMLSVAASLGVPVSDDFGALTLAQWTPLLSDGVHPTAQGYQQKAQIEAAILEPIVKTFQ
jgi:lysophospholipase L1-like esterase